MRCFNRTFDTREESESESVITANESFKHGRVRRAHYNFKSAFGGAGERVSEKNLPVERDSRHVYVSEGCHKRTDGRTNGRVGARAKEGESARNGDGKFFRVLLPRRGRFGTLSGAAQKSDLIKFLIKLLRVK